MKVSSQGAQMESSRLLFFVGIVVDESIFNRAVFVMNVVPLPSVTFGGSP